MSPQATLPPPPTFAAGSDDPWNLVARTGTVNKSWRKLCQRAPTESAVCYQDLLTQPMTRYPGRVYPLKGKRYKGAWCYEVTAGDRVYYIPDYDAKTVEVYYADAHPKGPAAPTP